MNFDDNHDDKIEMQIKNMLETVLGEEKIDETAFATLGLSDNQIEFTSQDFLRKEKKAFTTVEKMPNEIIQLNVIDPSLNYMQTQNIRLPDNFYAKNYETENSIFGDNNYKHSNIFQNHTFDYPHNNQMIQNPQRSFNKNYEPQNLNSNFMISQPNMMYASNNSLNKNMFHFNNNNVMYHSPNLSFNSSYMKNSASNSPENVYERGQRKFNTVQTNFPPSQQFHINMMQFKRNNLDYHHQNYVSAHSHNNSSSSLFSQDSFPVKLKQRKFVIDDHNCFPSNEFDSILENNVSPVEKIDEETYNLLKGNFFKIFTTQNGSRVLQKGLKKTSKDILSRILYEVHNFLILGPTSNS
jgi:hypothetical protein